MSSESSETPAIMQPNDPELQLRAEQSLGDGYQVSQGQIIGDNDRNINKNFNMGVANGPWIGPDSKVEGTYAAGLPDLEARGALEDGRKATRIFVNAYPMGLTGESQAIERTLSKRAEAAVVDHWKSQS